METSRLCSRHPARDGIGICKSCGRVVCEECGAREEGILRCRDCLAARLGTLETVSLGRHAAAAAAGAVLFALAFGVLVYAFQELIRIVTLWGG